MSNVFIITGFHHGEYDFVRACKTREHAVREASKLLIDKYSDEERFADLLAAGEIDSESADRDEESAISKEDFEEIRASYQQEDYASVLILWTAFIDNRMWMRPTPFNFDLDERELEG